MGLWIRSLMNISWYHYRSKYWNSIMKTSDLVDMEDLLHFFFIEHKVVWKLLLEWLHLLLCSCLSHSDLSHPDEYFVRQELRLRLGQRKGPHNIKSSYRFWGKQKTNCKFKNQSLNVPKEVWNPWQPQMVFPLAWGVGLQRTQEFGNVNTQFIRQKPQN